MFHDAVKKDVAVALLYDFDQLDEKVQQKIIQDSRVSFAENVDYDYDISSFIVEAENKGLSVKEKDIRYSLSGMQGDGASFTTDDIDFRKVIMNSDLPERFPFLKDKRKLDFVLEGLKGRIFRVEPLYTHKDTVVPEVTYHQITTYEKDRELLLIGRKFEHALEVELENIKDDLCNSLYENLQDTHNNELSDENIRDYYKSSGDKFFIDGTRANPEIFDYSDNAKRAIAFMKLPVAIQEDIGSMIDKESALANKYFGR